MKTASDALKAVLALDHFYMADLYTIELRDGTVLRYTTADMDLVVSGNTYRSGATLFERSQITWGLGIEVDTVDLQAYPAEDDLVGGVPFAQALALGLFDGAEFTIERAFMETFGDTSPGTVVLFAGLMGELSDMASGNAPLLINSFTELLNTKMPRRLYQAACQYLLFDAGCAVSKATYEVDATVGPGATVSAIPVPGTGKSDGWFDRGTITIDGQVRTVKKWASDIATVYNPFFVVPAAGAAVLLLPGCERTRAICEAKFNNLARFRGFPYVPRPETAI